MQQQNMINNEGEASNTVLWVLKQSPSILNNVTELGLSHLSSENTGRLPPPPTPLDSE